MKGRLWFKEFFLVLSSFKKQCLTLIVVYLEMVLFSFLGYIGDDDMASEPEQSWRALIGCWWCHLCASNAWEKHQGLTVFLTFLSFFLPFFLFLFSPNMKSHFHTKSTFGVSYLSNVITKVASDRFAQTDTAWLDTQFQFSRRGFCAASHWISLLRNFLSLQQTLSRAPFL